MKEFKFIQGISLRVILLFGVAFLGTFLSDYLSSISMFGDYTAVHHNSEYAVTELNKPLVEEFVRYGARHVWYIVCLVVLFILQLISLIWFISRRISELNETE